MQKNQPSALADAPNPETRFVAANSKTDARWFPRAEIRWPVVIKALDAFYHAETTNISRAGAFIACPEPLRLSESFELIIMPPGAGRVLNIIASVVWSTRPGTDDPRALCDMGVRFDSLADADRTLISDAVVNHHRERNAGK